MLAVHQPGCRHHLNKEVGGSDEETACGGHTGYLQLDDEAAAAVVSVEFASRDGASVRCTGTYVGWGWVITAAHCTELQGRDLLGHILTGPGNEAIAVRRTVRHPELDVALLNLIAEVPGARPLLLTSTDPHEFLKTPAQTAGFGVKRELRFGAANVDSLSPTTLSVTALWGSDSCIGDSGGPLMVRNDGGQIAVLGVLWKGSVTCRTVDSYVRGDILADWVSRTVGALPTDDRSCGPLSSEGDCFSGIAVWCDSNGHRAAQHCDLPLTCGWSAEVSGFRCVREDPCRGVSRRGQCRGLNRRIRCLRGRVVASVCAAPKRRCEISSQDAEARCVPSEIGNR
jgi:hypothetical protein